MTEHETAPSVPGTEVGNDVELVGWWRFDEASGTRADDRSGHGHKLTATGDPAWTAGGRFGGGVAVDGDGQWLSADGPVVKSDEGFSIAAWVRLDSAVMGSEVALKPDWYAVTAVSQDGPSHSSFYLGARLIEQKHQDAPSTYILRWNFTASPENPAGTFDWQHAHARRPIEAAELDQWVLLVGVYDPATGTARVYVPGNDDSGEKTLPDGWPKWNAPGGFQVGRGKFREEPVDQWPGSIGQVRAYRGLLTAADAASLYTQDKLAGA
jgi:Concanavalin A-like lectin/glucanases superfamily